MPGARKSAAQHIAGVKDHPRVKAAIAAYLALTPNSPERRRLLWGVHYALHIVLADAEKTTVNHASQWVRHRSKASNTDTDEALLLLGVSPPSRRNEEGAYQLRMVPGPSQEAAIKLLEGIMEERRERDHRERKASEFPAPF